MLYGIKKLMIDLKENRCRYSITVGREENVHEAKAINHENRINPNSMGGG